MSGIELYETDFVLWSEQQGARLREAAVLRPNEPIDWQNLAEEIETLGRSERREVASLVRLILLHLLKIDLSPAIEPRRGWLATVQRAQADLAERLTVSPSIRPEIPTIIAREWPRSRLEAATELEIYAEFDAAQLARRKAAPFTSPMVLGVDP